MGFELTIPVFERPNTVRASDRSVIGTLPPLPSFPYESVNAVKTTIAMFDWDRTTDQELSDTI